MMARMAVVLALMTVLVLAVPVLWLGPVSPLVAMATDVLSPQLDSVSVAVKGMEVQAQGRFHLDVRLVNGDPLPDLRTWWKKSAWKTLGIWVVAATIWAGPPAGWRRRWMLLPVMLGLAAGVSAYDLGIEIQETMLRDLVPRLLQDYPLAATAANSEQLDRLKAWHQTVWRLRQFNEGGGRMALAVWAGWMAHALPSRKRSDRRRASPDRKGLPGTRAETD